jgi:hypothetical protein
MTHSYKGNTAMTMAIAVFPPYRIGWASDLLWQHVFHFLKQPTSTILHLLGLGKALRPRWSKQRLLADRHCAASVSWVKSPIFSNASRRPFCACALICDTPFAPGAVVAVARAFVRAALGSRASIDLASAGSARLDITQFSQLRSESHWFAAPAG